MKLLILVLSFFISFQSLASSMNTLNFIDPCLKIEKVAIRKPIQTNLIRLYQRLPSEMRMIAGYKEVRTSETKISWLDGLRNRLKPTHGQMRL